MTRPPYPWTGARWPRPRPAQAVWPAPPWPPSGGPGTAGALEAHHPPNAAGDSEYCQNDAMLKNDLFHLLRENSVMVIHNY